MLRLRGRRLFHHPDGQQLQCVLRPTAEQAALIHAPPLKDLVRVHAITLCHPRHRRPSHQRLFDYPPPLHRAPAKTPNTHPPPPTNSASTIPTSSRQNTTLYTRSGPNAYWSHEGLESSLHLQSLGIRPRPYHRNLELHSVAFIALLSADILPECGSQVYKSQSLC